MKSLHPLRAYRREHGLSCSALGKRLDYAETTVRSFENGTRTITADAAVHIEKKLGIPRERLRPDLFARSAA